MTEQGFERAKQVKKELSTLYDHRRDVEKSIRFETNVLESLKVEHCPIPFDDFKSSYLQSLDAEIKSLINEFRKLY